MTRSARCGGSHAGGSSPCCRTLIAVVLFFVLQPAGPAEAQWIEAPGDGWLHASLVHHDTRERYDFDGSSVPFFADGHAVTSSMILTGAFGLFRAVDSWVQLPVHRLRYRDAAGLRTRAGVADPRVFVRAAPFGLFGRTDVPVPVAIRVGLKLPLGEFPVDSEVIPLGEGQRDWEVILEAGRSLHPRPFYLMGWVGWRFREANEEIGIDFADERFYFLAAGGTVRGFGYKVALEGWHSGVPRIEGFRLANARRDMIQLLPTIQRRMGPGDFELSGRFPIRGKNLPAGYALGAGYFLPWSIGAR